MTFLQKLAVVGVTLLYWFAILVVLAGDSLLSTPPVVLALVVAAALAYLTVRGRSRRAARR